MDDLIYYLQFIIFLIIIGGLWYFLRNIAKNSFRNREISSELIEEISELKKEISELKQELKNKQ